MYNLNQFTSSGIDIAFTKMGHVYHTRNDVAELIRPGVVQNAGDMLLGLVSDLADLEHIGEKVAGLISIILLLFHSSFIEEQNKF